jgi:hypothetical protein
MRKCYSGLWFWPPDPAGKHRKSTDYGRSILSTSVLQQFPVFSCRNQPALLDLGIHSSFLGTGIQIAFPVLKSENASATCHLRNEIGMAHFYSRFPLLEKGTVLALPFLEPEQEHYLPSSHNFVVYVVIYFPFSLDLLLLFCFCYSADNKLILSLIDLYLLIRNLRDVTLLVESTLISIRWLSHNSIEHIWEVLIRTWGSLYLVSFDFFCKVNR